MKIKKYMQKLQKHRSDLEKRAEMQDIKNRMDESLTQHERDQASDNGPMTSSAKK